MTADPLRYAFGPVPSRRLGRSLGINNIPAKACTYSCVYCQVGRTPRTRKSRRAFHDPKDIFQDVERRLAEAEKVSERIDYLTFVPDGEPTLDLNLGEEILRLKTLKVPVGVITNGSLLGRKDVREELAQADWVSIKIDAAQETPWRRINRPHQAIRLAHVQEGMLAFAEVFTGRLVTETMLVAKHNDDDRVDEVADFLHQLQPSVAYVSVPTRPPAEKWVHPPAEEVLHRCYQRLSDKVSQVEYLIDYEGDHFDFTGDVGDEILRITSVHPMRVEAVEALLARAGSSWVVVARLLTQGSLIETRYNGHLFYSRRFATDREAQI